MLNYKLQCEDDRVKGLKSGLWTDRRCGDLKTQDMLVGNTDIGLSLSSDGVKVLKLDQLPIYGHWC